MKIFNLFTSKKEVQSSIKEYTVEEIHAEFDSAEERVINECENLLKEIQIPLESKIESKANNLKSLGFINVETIKQAELISKRNNELKSKIALTETQVNTIKELKLKYPLEKFITVDELNRICKKYNLMYAPVKNYIKDVPEKNVNDMMKMKPLAEEDKCPSKNILTSITFFPNHTEDYRRYVLDLFYCKEFPYDKVTEINMRELCETFKGTRGDIFYFNEATIRKVNKKGLFISAPKSHFDLTNLSKESEFGFYDVEEVTVKDPVVFEFCKNDIVRICTKWGTEDDQSYLDSSLIDESLN